MSTVFGLIRPEVPSNRKFREIEKSGLITSYCKSGFSPNLQYRWPFLGRLSVLVYSSQYKTGMRAQDLDGCIKLVRKSQTLPYGLGPGDWTIFPGPASQ